MSTKSVSITLVLTLTALFCGYIIGSQKELTTIESPVETSKQQLAQQFQNLSNQEMIEYHKLKSSKEKYEKAREIYGKAFQLFLAYIGIKYERTPFYTLDKELEKETPSLKTTPTSLPKYPEKSDKQTSFPTFAEPDPHVQEYENSENEDEDEKKLKILGPLKNPTKVFNNAEVIRFNPNFEKLQGTYEGKVDIENDGQDSYDLRIELNYPHDGKDYKGSTRIIITSPEGKNSRKTGDGINNAFQADPKRPKDLIIESSPNSFILFPKLLKDGKWKRKTINGHYYEKKPGKKKYYLKGAVIIRRL